MPLQSPGAARQPRVTQLGELLAETSRMPLQWPGHPDTEQVSHCDRPPSPGIRPGGRSIDHAGRTMPNPQRSSSPLNRANPDLSPATRHNPALGITAVAQPGFSRASRWTVSHGLSRPSPSCGARGSAAAEGRPESDPGPIVAAVEPDELELGGVTAFRPARRDRGRPASPRNGPEAVTELADVRDVPITADHPVRGDTRVVRRTARCGNVVEVSSSTAPNPWYGKDR